MKLSLMSFTMLMDGVKKYLDADLLCRIIKESGLDEVDLMQMEFYIYGKDALSAALKKYNIRCGCLIMEAPFYTNYDGVGSEIKAALDMAKEIGTTSLMIVPGNTNEPDRMACEKLGRQGILDRTVECFQKAVELANTYGIQVMFENTPHDFKPLSSAVDCLYVLAQVPGLGFVFDTANFRVADTKNDELKSYELLKERIVRFHLKDVRIGDYPMGEKCVDGQALKLVMEGSGVIPMESLIQRSLADGFDGTYAIEYPAPSDTHGVGHISTVEANRRILEQMADGSRIQCPQVEFPGLEKKVSKIFFGTAIMPMMLDANAKYLLDLAYVYGINAYDCARGYGNAEVVLGQWIQERQNREDVVILTKCGNVSGDGTVCINRDVIRRELTESLERLQTSYIDIYLLHRDDPKTSAGEILETLNQAKSEGKIKVFGVSNWTHERIQEANDYAKIHGLEGFQVSSPNYGLARQVADPWGGGCVTISGPENVEAQNWYQREQMPVIAYSSLGRGFFSGKFKSFKYEGARVVLDSVAQKGYLSEDNMERLQKAEEIAEIQNLKVPQIAMQYVLNSPMRMFAIASMTKFERIYENVQAACIPMKQEVWDKLHFVN